VVVFSDVLRLSYRSFLSLAAPCKRSPGGAETVPVNLVLAAENSSPPEPCLKQKYLRHSAWSILSFQTCKRGVRVTPGVWLQLCMGLAPFHGCSVLGVLLAARFQRAGREALDRSAIFTADGVAFAAQAPGGQHFTLPLGHCAAGCATNVSSPRKQLYILCATTSAVSSALRCAIGS